VPTDFADEPAELLDLVDLRLPLASLAFPHDARLGVAFGLSPAKQFDQAAEDCHVSPCARER
jgi:hypothetical protein